eukprot:655844-Pelagomonas_calceolata.AAC.5
MACRSVHATAGSDILGKKESPMHRMRPDILANVTVSDAIVPTRDQSAQESIHCTETHHR